MSVGRRAAMLLAGLAGVAAAVATPAPSLAESVERTPPPVEQPAAVPGPEALVPEITARDLQRLRRASGRVLLLDARDASEFAVSRLAGSERVEVPPDQLSAKLGRRLVGAHVVLYCTMTSRSGYVAQAAWQDLLAAGARSVHVLAGGIVAWHDQGRPLVDRKGPTPYVHTYDATVAKRLKRPHLARFEPR